MVKENNPASIDRINPESIKLKEIEEHNEEIESIRREGKAKGKIIYDEEDRFAYAIASNGEKSNLTERQYLEVRSSTFKKWFGGDWEEGKGSVTLDVNGEPRVFYHTTNAKNFSEFRGNQARGGKIWFSFDSTSYLEAFQAQVKKDSQPNVVLVFLRIMNNGIDKECDGFIQGDENNNESEVKYPVVFPSEVTVNDPKQVKSATQNNGLYSTETANIYE